MAAEIRIPQLGESITEATLVRWLKADGAHVDADEVVLELETEKATMEVQAETAGQLSIVVPAGSRVHPGDVVGRITEAVTTERAAPVTAGRTSHRARWHRALSRARPASRRALPSRRALLSRRAPASRHAPPSREAMANARLSPRARRPRRMTATAGAAPRAPRTMPSASR